MPRLMSTETDWENVFAMLCLAFICWYAMHICDSEEAKEIPRVVDTIAGGFIGYLVKAQKVINQYKNEA